MRIPLYALSGAVVFSGAFLLFAIQPMAGKQLLPLFGGASSVWATSLLFFTTALFIGYLYVYGLAKLPERTQPLVHAGLIGLALLFTAASAISVQDVSVSFPWGERFPALGVLAALAVSIGIPYVLLASTGPLVQYWHGSLSGKAPYSLYALSNAASLLALLAYPFLIEPVIALRYQRGAWIALFAVYALLAAASAYVFFSRAVSGSLERPLPEPASREEFFRRVLWVALASLPAFMLVATTTQITQVIAPVPLLWVVPLVLYLLTFIIAFSGRGRSIFTPLLFLASALAAWRFTPAAHADLALQILSYLGVLFFCGLACHALLYRMRPSVSSLPLFYLLLSLGGALGALAASILPPLLFADYWEFPLGLALSGALSIWLLPDAFFPRILDARRIFIAKIVLMLLAASLFARLVLADEGAIAVASRNFYGNAKVVFDENFISLKHGTTLHGTQFADAAAARLPTTYYTPGSGVGRAVLFEQGARGAKGVRVGIIGLGAGSLAAYCRPGLPAAAQEGDAYVFYEIDARIERIARSYFSYLSHCEGSEARIGDGRLILEAERERGALGAYDVLAVDAFSDDTIPVHLLTLQAFELYAAHLRSPESILAVHISNRYLDLGPVVFRLAAELGFNAALVADSGESTPGGTPSNWVVLSKDAGVFHSTAFVNAGSFPPAPAERPWTDDYSSLFPALDIPKPWE